MPVDILLFHFKPGIFKDDVIVSDISHEHGDVLDMFINFESYSNGFRDRFHRMTVGSDNLLSFFQASSRELVMADEGIIDKGKARGSAVYHSVCYRQVVDLTWNDEMCMNTFIAINNRHGRTNRKNRNTKGVFLPNI